MESTPTKPDPIAVLAHPVVIASLVGWLINDWVLKARLGSEVTGKLSDVFAMVVFPLLIAVVAGRVSKHPLRWGLAINTVFFAAINLFASADSFVEQTLNLVVKSRLTMDPTDLAVLPVMAVAAIVWRRVHESSSDARRTARQRVGRFVFAAGAVTCLATSAPEATRSAPHSGSTLLTAENPTVTMPLEYDLNGNPNPDLDVTMTLTAYGPGDGGNVSNFNTVEWNATPSQLSFNLIDPSWAPVHVEWRVEALGETPDCGIFRCSDAAEATLSIEVPPLASKPVPDHRVDVPPTDGGEYSLALITFVVDAADPPTLELPDRGSVWVELDDRQLTRQDRTRTWPIPIPNGCSDPCRVTVPVIYSSDETASFGVFGTLRSFDIETPPLVETSTELMIPVDEIPVGAQARQTFCLRADRFGSVAENLAIAGLRASFDPQATTRLEVSTINDQGCLATDSVWFGPDDLSEQEQLIITGVVRTTEDNAPENFEIVLIE